MNIPVILVDVIEDAVKAMKIQPINFDAGRNIQIVQGLVELDNTRTLKGIKYPLIALQLPAPEDRGTGYHSLVKIKRILIATLSSEFVPVLDRYKDGGTFKSILYPIYYEFLRCLANSTQTIGGDPEAIRHTKVDNPAAAPISDGLTDFVDAIEILNMELILLQTKIC